MTSASSSAAAAAASEQLALDKLGLDKLFAGSVFGGAAVPASPSTALGVVTVGLSAWHVVMPTFIDEAFALIPHHTVISPVVFCPFPFFWNLVTAHLFEADLLKAVLILPWVFLLTRTLERLWSTHAIAIHIVFCILLSGALFFVMEMVRVFRIQAEKEFFVPARGCIGLVAALAVALRHAYPFEMVPVIPRAWGWQYQHVPFAVTAAATVLGFLMPWWFPEWPFAPSALFLAWLHIRYVMWFPYAAEYGDHSSEFEFASLFPRALQPVVAFLGTLFYGVIVLAAPTTFKLRETDGTTDGATKYDPARAARGHSNAGSELPYAHSGGDSSSGAAENGGGRSREYDIRRAKALKLLDANIAALLAPPAAAAAAGGGESDEASASKAAAVSTAAAEDVEAPASRGGASLEASPNGS
eukprot:CAMPEP_0178370340 /NCGR_PEP_ID=MMETSP0689_2-20121128/251_1 /TAXON_ID=160604 /ORGANISM="Amphidinium massartii, Strain CS-259" /LENGTH=413 /DNA_ID=CAMNT_0019990157 /DNA_START=26 /DNA_END=1264 /DNA_ORIENTATION=+